MHLCLPVCSFPDYCSLSYPILSHAIASTHSFRSSDKPRKAPGMMVLIRLCFRSLETEKQKCWFMYPCITQKRIWEMSVCFLSVCTMFRFYCMSEELLYDQRTVTFHFLGKNIEPTGI